jgi:predicted enzyme related to lactoylglutathione lyase
MMFQGLRTVVYKVTDIAQAKDWYSRALGIEPYYDQPYYVGFSVGGFELGLDPDVSTSKPGPGGAVAYWGVADIDAAVVRLLGIGATGDGTIGDVGEGIRMAVLGDPFGNAFGIIHNPRFKAD